MTSKIPAIGYSDGDTDTNRSSNPTIHDIISQGRSRREMLSGGLTAASVFFAGGLLSACGGDASFGGPFGTSPTVTGNATTTARSGNIVTLTGTATDADGTITSQSWTQTSGPTVTLENASGLVARFVAPSVTAATTLGFRFTATDDGARVTTTDVTTSITPAALGFTAVAKSLGDTVIVPEGYSISVLYRTGDPINAATPAYANDGSDTNFGARGGDHHDGMSFFGLAATGTTRDDNSSTRGVLVMNHENINQQYLHPNGPTTVGGARPEGEARKEIEAHGVAVIEVVRSSAGAWSYVQSGALNRRITPLTPTSFSGPVRGNALLRTVYSPTGVAGRGTINNCANGTMPWGTYLTCEENWAGYFRRDAADTALRTAKQNVAMTRYGLGVRTGNYGWATVNSSSADFAKFNITTNAAAPADGTGDYRNECNQLGWVVEIDPYDAAATPRKRTALGRMNHEGCWPGRRIAGVRPAFYMGDDAQNEYIYKFVSTQTWAAADATATDRLAIGDKYLDAGTLYVARFNADGTGTWVPLVFGQNGLTATNATYAFTDQADVLTHCRIASDIVGATKMDRPEWTAVNPATGEVYCTLTNNSSRTVAGTDAANPRAYTDPKTNGTSTSGNPNGHIIRLRETGDTTEATGFTWDIYAFGSGADLSAANINLSGLDATNDFSSPDGLWFGRATNPSGLVTPVMWLQTDDGAYTDVTNCMMLAAMPGSVGDGATRTITNTIGATSGTQTARAGRAPGTTLRRFLVGPKECEITGVDSTPDGRTLFVNIQHPGENGTPAAPSSNWPNSQTGTATGIRPRSATIAITKNDGGVVAL
ncbi:DUF839 domain-containing protein [Sphingomonas naphthae]|uniref:DUF839 domain-containing protein n=1 Tax=Sphingomonas naphthae TaxID=1813468 RepID=A0ABY7TPN8_9SPHN|nr:alkaline phosphatase PhoX [Sphingomonas naphthae]WCT74993.1 DUF839 domain-containing protein [Sphingomonas naphthae]